MGLDHARHNISIVYRAPQRVVDTQVFYNSLQLSGGTEVKMMWEVVEQMVARGFIGSDLYVTVEPAVVEAGEGSQHTVLDGTVNEHIDSIPLQSYQGWAENTRDGYGSEPWQTFPHVNSTEEEEGPQQVHEGEQLSPDELHGGTSPSFEDDGLSDDATNIDVTRDDFEELLDTMGEHEDVDHIEDVVVEENRDTCPGPDPTPEWFTKNTWDNMFDPSPVMQAEVSSWTLGEQPVKGMVFVTKLAVRHALTWYAVRENCSFKTEHSDSERLMVWDAKQKAVAAIYGDFKKSYAELPRFLAGLKDASPGTKYKLLVDDHYERGTCIFKAVFWAFRPCIVGFKHCRPVISIDATHLYGKYKGKLMIAMATDANNKIYPLAFAVVESESTETWGWFLACLRRYVTSRSELCVISDRHLGIQAVFRDTNRDFLQTPMTEHRYCLRHVCSNVNSRWNNETLKNLVWRAASATQERKFNATFELIENVNRDAHKYLEDVPKEKWALAFDEGFRYGAMTTNVSECFNGVLKGARNLPITAMVKYTWFKLNTYFDDRRNKSIAQLKSGKRWCKYAFDIFMRNKAKAEHHRVTRLICIRYRHDAEQYIDQCYSMNALFRSYAPVFPALKDRLSWPDPKETRKVVPNPRLIREKGHPVSTRIRNEMDEGRKQLRTTPWKEGGRKVQCGLCDQEGHNRRTCPKRNEASVKMVDVELRGSAHRIKKCACDLLSIGGDLVDDDGIGTLMGNDLRLKSTFLYCDFNRMISSAPRDQKKPLTELANKLFCSIETLINLYIFALVVYTPTSLDVFTLAVIGFY
ncbi:hypothetical protein SO802_029157 [Lithocarpus litseifolius]|uniref:MULE transposase domain-containing protein n=1 Tax=Lithocarpus litseifolius TaxID=425828 RepID=A0AAW2BTX9_9ROSI